MRCKEVTSTSQKELVHEPMLQIMPSYDCNLNCYFCKVGDLIHNPNYSSNELPVSAFLDFMELINTKNVNISGGEPFYGKNKDKTYAIIEKAIAMKAKKIYINTNGTIPLPDFNFVAPDTIIKIAVSLDGIEKQHDAIRGEGVFEKAVSFMRDMLNKGYYVSCKPVIKEVPTLAWCNRYFGYLREHKLINSPIDMRYIRNAGNAKDMENFIKVFSEMTSFPFYNFNKYLEDQCVGLETVTQCYYEGKKDELVVDPYGNIIPCSNNGHGEVILGNILSYNPEEVQENMKKFYANRNCYSVTQDLSIKKHIIPGTYCRDDHEFMQKFYKEN